MDPDLNSKILYQFKIHSKLILNWDEGPDSHQMLEQVLASKFISNSNLLSKRNDHLKELPIHHVIIPRIQKMNTHEEIGTQE